MGAPIRFGMAPAVHGPNTEEQLHALCDALTRAIGLVVKGRTADSYGEIALAFERGQVDVAWLPPVPALRGAGRGILVPVAIPVRRGRSGFAGILFSRADSSFRTLGSLRGARAVWVDPRSAAGYLVIRAKLRAERIDPTRAFATERFLGSHDAVLRAVMSGEADVGGTYAGQEGVHVLLETEPIPDDVVAVSTRLRPAVAEAIHRALVGETADPAVVGAARALFVADRFDAPMQKHLEPLAKLLEATPTQPATTKRMKRAKPA